MEELLQREPTRTRAKVTVTEAFWTRGTNIVTVKLRDRKPKITVLIKKSNLKVKNVFIHNDLIWKKRQIQREIRLIAEAEKAREATVRIGYKSMRENLCGRGFTRAKFLE